MLASQYATCMVIALRNCYYILLLYSKHPVKSIQKFTWVDIQRVQDANHILEYSSTSRPQSDYYIPRIALEVWTETIISQYILTSTNTSGLCEKYHVAKGVVSGVWV